MTDPVDRLQTAAAAAIANERPCLEAETAGYMPGHPGVPYGDREAGKPQGRDTHHGHDVANLTTRRAGEGAIGRRVCLTCEVILGPLVLCNEPTKKSRPCTVPVRTDLGHTVCWSHGEGKGRTSRPRRQRQNEQPCRPNAMPERMALGGRNTRAVLGLDDPYDPYGGAA